VLDDEPDVDDEPDPEEEDEEEGSDPEKQEKKLNKPEIKTNREKDPLRSYKKSTWLKFHGLMVIGSIYFSMLMTNWAAYEITGKTFGNLVPNETSMWIKLGAAWVTAVLYCWTLIAPMCFPDREFGGDNDMPEMEN
jgi:hypothetical protein